VKELTQTDVLSPSEKELLLRCRHAVESVDPGAEVVLYGSRARGEARGDSDFDLLILSDGPANLTAEDTFRHALYPIELDTGAVITVILISRQRWQTSLYRAMPLHQNVTREGIKL
jgi:predicted nucleotidyltransferase